MTDLITHHKLLTSVLLIAFALLIRWLIVRHLRKLPSSEDDLPRRWMNTVRNAVTALVVIGLIIIWLSELRFVALSIATFTVAIIIATREFIQCFVGALYQTSTRAFAIGDWIRVVNHSGEVVSTDWLTTRLLEIDLESSGYGYTGKSIVLPNNQLVINPVYNLNFMRRYVAHSFTIVREAEPVNVFRAKDLMLEKARAYCEPFSDVAHRYGERIEKRLGITLCGPDPSVRITTSNLGKNQITISVFCPTDQAVNIEQKLTADFMQFWYGEVRRLQLEKIPNPAQKSHQDSAEAS